MPLTDTNPFVPVLTDAAHQDTGCLFITDATGSRSGKVYFVEEQIYAVHVDGFLPKIGARLRTGGMLTEDQYNEVLTAVGDDIYSPHFGAVAVERGYIDKEVLDAVLREILLSSVGAMFSWIAPTGKFKKNATTDQFTIPPVAVEKIVLAVGRRRDRWEEVWGTMAPGMTPEHTYPLAVAVPESSEPLPSEVTAVLNAATGARSLDAVAGECGLTRFEVGHVLSKLVSKDAVHMNATPTEPAHAQDWTRGGTAEAAQTDTTEETAAFGAADDVLPDGADVGSPNDQGNPTVPDVDQPEHADASEPTDTVLPVAAPEPVTQTHGDQVPVPEPGLPASAPVFVDASAFDAHRSSEGMPGVPLPPLPFFGGPSATPVPLPRLAAPGPEEGGELAEENHTPGADPGYLAFPDHGTVAKPDEAVAPQEPQTVAPDPRVVAARERLDAEIDAQAAFLAAATAACTQAHADEVSHAAVAREMDETLRRYSEFLTAAEADHARLTGESETVERDRVAAARAHDDAQDRATRIASDTAEAQEAVDRAHEALRKAEADLHDAEGALTRSQEEAAITATQAAESAAALDACDIKAATLAADLNEVTERIASHQHDITELTEMAAAVTHAHERAHHLAQEARERQETAARALASKQERLAHLD